MITATLPARRTHLVRTAARLADSFLHPSFRRSADFPVRELKALTEAGLLRIPLPLASGGDGIGLDPGLSGSLLAILKEIGRGSLPLGRIFEGHVNAIMLLDAFGSTAQMARAAEDVLSHNCVFGVWNTGPHGSPALTPLSDGTYELTGVKTFATGASRIERAIVTASLPGGGWQMCLIPLSAISVKIQNESWDPLGMGASESFTVEFTGVILPPDAMIGKPGDYYAEPAFTGGALRYCAVHLGGAQALFDACRNMVRALGREYDPFQLRRLGEMAVLMESSRQWLVQAGEWMDSAFSNPGELPVKAQMMRIATEEICTRIIQTVQLSVGARGLTSAEPLASTIRDLQMYLRQAGYDQAFLSAGRFAMEEPGKSE